MIVQPLLY